MADVGTILTTSRDNDLGQVVEAHVEEPIVPLSIFRSDGIQELPHFSIRESQHETLPEVCATLDVPSDMIDWIQSEQNVDIRHARLVPVVEIVEPKCVLECTILFGIR